MAAKNIIKFGTSWKTSLSTDPATPRCSLVSLWDLLFWWDERIGDWRARYNYDSGPSSYDHVGYELDHNVIAFNDLMYAVVAGTGRTFEQVSENSFDNFTKYGIDLSLSTFDKRSKPTFLTRDNVADIVKDQRYTSVEIQAYFSKLIAAVRPRQPALMDDLYSRSMDGFKVYERAAALAPTNTFDFYTKRACYKGSLDSLDPTDERANTWHGYGGVKSAYRVAIDDDYQLFENSEMLNEACDIMLCFEDKLFEQRFNLDTTRGWRAYNGICLNYYSKNVWLNAYKAFNSELDLDNVNDLDITAFFSAEALQNNDQSESYGCLHTNSGQSDNACNPVAEYLLRHTFVWVKASFYADYVDYRDFDQTLNRFSDVRHRNVMLGSGSWKRYDDAFTREKSITEPRLTSEPGLPYIPITTPALDAYTRTLFDPIQTESTIAAVVDAMRIEASRLTSRFGAVPVRPLEEANSIDDFTTPPASPPPPPIWFDPASRGPSDSYLDVPIGFGKDGNLVMHGRILSPTIDELWMAIKSLAMGRNADGEKTPDVGYPVGDAANPLKDKTTPTDTRFVSKKHRIEEKFVGDPMTIVADFDAEPGSYKVSAWVNDPSYIQYQFLSDLKSINDELTDDDKKGYPFSESDDDDDRTSPDILTAPYLPDATVWSNREIEAAIKGLRYNLVNWAKFSQLNATWAGPLGNKNSDLTYSDDSDDLGSPADPTNVAGGTAYMLHKDYDSKSGNTVYDSRFDSSRPSPEKIGVGVQLLSLEEIPDFRTRPDGSSNYPAFSAYLAADGTWRSTWQSVNVRVVGEDIEPF